VQYATEEIARLHPSYMSVTYGAGGGTSEFTAAIAKNIQHRFGVPSLAHLSCASSNRERIHAELAHLKECGIENILALRGDLPEGTALTSLDFRYASQLITEIQKCGDFCIGGACYPEGHPESPTMAEDMLHLKEKVDAGCDFLTTQMFFDNGIYYNYLYRLREYGISVPVVPGIMPVTNAKQIKRICAISGTALPTRFCRIADHFGSSPNAMMQAGIAYATEQIIDLLANGVRAIHVYSMNNPSVATKILQNLDAIL
jgi:methylenetetrahydrofolate reductase (NADPH)